jgi:hypothetical protein
VKGVTEGKNKVGEEEYRKKKKAFARRDDDV